MPAPATRILAFLITTTVQATGRKQLDLASYLASVVVCHISSDDCWVARETGETDELSARDPGCCESCPDDRNAAEPQDCAIVRAMCDGDSISMAKQLCNRDRLYSKQARKQNPARPRERVSS